MGVEPNPAPAAKWRKKFSPCLGRFFLFELVSTHWAEELDVIEARVVKGLVDIEMFFALRACHPYLFWIRDARIGDSVRGQSRSLLIPKPATQWLNVVTGNMSALAKIA
jgi:hypothetical protein